MIMSIIGFDKKIEFKEGNVNVLEIYNKKFFYNFINNINEQCNGYTEEDNNIVIMEEAKRIKISQSIYLLIDVFNIEFNTKKVINKIYSVLLNNIKNRQDNELENLMLKLRNYLIEEINEIPFEFNMNSEMETVDILKAFDIKIDTSCYTTIVEKVEFIINIISNLKIADILVIPNLKSYLSEDELIEIYKYSIYNNVKLLIVENSKAKKILKYEQKNVIDENFEEY